MNGATPSTTRLRRLLGDLGFGIGIAVPGMITGGLGAAHAYFTFAHGNRDSLAPAVFGLTAGLAGAVVGASAAALTGAGLRALIGASGVAGFRRIGTLALNALLWAGLYAVAIHGLDSVAAPRAFGRTAEGPPAERRSDPCAVDPDTLSDSERRSWASECR